MPQYPPNYLNLTQGSAEWLEARRGCVTASRVKDVVAKLKSGKESEKRHSYKMELLAEIITGRVTEHYVSVAMDFGTENEPLARTAYEFQTGFEVERIGFVKHEAIPRCGASPDGLVGDDGMVEIKVPNTTTHLEYLLEGVVPEEYKPQMMFQMSCAGREWCDFVSYDPRLPQELSLFVARFHRDEVEILQMDGEVERFIGEINAMCERLTELRPPIQAGPGPEKAVIPQGL